MWQDIIVWIIVGVAAVAVLRTLWRTVAGRRACDDECGGCPFSEECHEPEKRPRKQKSGCGCGCH
jgi:hypothetical protein